MDFESAAHVSDISRDDLGEVRIESGGRSANSMDKCGDSHGKGSYIFCHDFITGV